MSVVRGMFGRRPDHEPALESGQRSLAFVLMAAVKHFEDGQFQAGITAWADALYLQHTGLHEQVSDREMVAWIRGVAGLEWEPPTGTERAPRVPK